MSHGEETRTASDRSWPGWPMAVVHTGWPAWTAIVLPMALYAWRPGLLIAVLILGSLPLGIAFYLAVAVPWDWCRRRCVPSSRPGRWRATVTLSLAHLLTVAGALAMLGATLLYPLLQRILQPATPPPP